MSELKSYTFQEPFELECGVVLPKIDIAYHTFGTMSPERDNVIWVCHALTANSDVADWWPHTVEEGKFLDPERYFIVCANMLGSHYGSTGPLSINPETGEPYYGDFPDLTIRDIIAAHQILAKHLGIESVVALMGSSIGGFQVCEWLVMEPEFAKKGILIATSAVSSPWAIALNESQRMSIESDSTYGDKSSEAGMKGMAAARSIALLSYRGGDAYNQTQMELDGKEKVKGFRASSYQRYQGDKLARRFNAYSYHLFTRLIDTHDIGRGRGGVEAALSTIVADVAVVAISSDILFTVPDHRPFVDYISGAKFYVIDSTFGHDGFLIEHEKLNTIIINHIIGVR